MKGEIVAISGVTVTVAIDGLKLYDRVRVGERRLAGEVVRLEPGRDVVRVEHGDLGRAREAGAAAHRDVRPGDGQDGQLELGVAE